MHQEAFFKPEHITVCICTYKRQEMLYRLLTALQVQETADRFKYSIVVVDNDSDESARAVVNSFQSTSVHLSYFCEPEQNIALARNKAVKNSQGDYLAFIDDDELPDSQWLLVLHSAICAYQAEGILGPVLPSFEGNPPQWVIKGKFFIRPTHPTGFLLDWTQSRTGNALIKRTVFDNEDALFKAEYGRGGEDRDFFCRVMSKGMRFIWCEEAAVFEIVPAKRYMVSNMLRRALIRGTNPSAGFNDLLKSICAIPVYGLALPYLLLMGQHVFIKVLIKQFDHIGRILTLFNIDLISDRYIT